MTMALSDLYRAVTEAICRAEALEAGGHERDAAIAYQAVSYIEEEIAELLPASDPEGALARQGAVTAAMSAGAVTRAVALANKYRAECDLPNTFSSELDALIV